VNAGSHSQSRLQAKGRLLIVLILIVSHNIVEPKLINTLRGADDPQPVTQLLLLEELLSQVLDVPSAELLVRNDLDTPVLEVRHVDGVAEVSGAAVDLDARLEEGREGGWVEDLVVGGLGGVDDVLTCVNVLRYWVG